MNRQKEKELEQAFERIIHVGLCIVPYEDLSDIVDPDLMLFGTAKDEKKFSFSELDAMFKSQYEQMDGFVPSLDRKRLFTRISADGNHACIAEQLTLSIASPEKVNTIPIRASCVMEYMDNRWKLVHWHASSPVDTENDHWHMEEWKREKEKLEKLVAERTADLQVKNRELEIEAASGRVRAVAMGMQEPDDIMTVLNVMKEEIDTFELGNIATWIWTKDEDGLITQWDISEVIEEGNLVNFNLTFDINKWPEVNRHAREWEKGKKYYALNWSGEKLKDIVDEVGQVDPDSGNMFRQAVEQGQIEDYWHAAAPFSKGAVGLDFISTPPEITESILLKISSAFEVAYQRFENLKKAEAQAREAKIETALERVRSRTMAMQKSDELTDASRVLDEQVRALGIQTWGCAFHIYADNAEGDFEWFSTANGSLPFYKTPRAGFFLDFYERGKRGEKFYIKEFAGEECKAHYDYLKTLPVVGDSLKDLEKSGIPLPDYQLDHVAFFNHGYILFITYEPVPEAHDIFQRFAKVFEQTYTRFLDLKKSEQQAYESKVEASLERVRGMAAAMNHSDDLMQIAEAMFREMEILKINPLRYGLGMIDGEKKEAKLWASTVDDGHYLDMLGTLSLTWHPMLKKVLDAWDAQHEELIYELKGKELSDYYQKIGQVNPDIPNLSTLQDPKTEITQYVSFFPFKSGALYAFTDGEPGEEGKSILKRFANLFEQAHIRYNDLQKAEQQARLIREERDRLDIALKELEATKDQLVQQEKLASLGQLTAGIAHEIKNPLNFVNNFSEVSVELVEETRKELSAVSDQLSAEDREKVHEALAILNDIEMNLKKIHEHGSRADSIVKSMLEHSRGGSGKMEPTDLNGLVKEYVNLSFHGMRAGKEPINVDIDLQLDENIGDVPLIAEDFSRVIVNLCNNAFDAMREKTLSPPSGHPSPRGRGAGGEGEYTPKLTVRTKSDGKNITLEIEDNGPGIPDDIKDKILQPFFTTKKGTEGTGLGLSITNDIIKAQGGTLEFKTEAGNGSVVVISLPAV